MSERAGRKYRKVHLSVSVMGCNPSICNDSAHFYEEFEPEPAPPAPPAAPSREVDRIVSEMYYAQKDGCRKHNAFCGKICYDCVREELARAESELEKLRELVSEARQIMPLIGWASVQERWDKWDSRAEAALSEKGSES